MTDLTGNIPDYEMDYPANDYGEESDAMTDDRGSDHIEILVKDTSYDDEDDYEDQNSTSESPPEESESDTVKTAAASTRSAATSTRLDYVPGIDSIPDDAVEIVALWRDLNDGKLIIDLKGKIFASAAEIKSTKYEARFANVVKELVKIAVEGGLIKPVQFKETAIKSTSHAPTPAAQIPKEKEEAETAPAPTGIADEIEMYLQQRLRVHPEFAIRSIHVRPAPGGGVSIEVDDEAYETVSDVQDDEIRSFLQEVMEEWSGHH